MFTKADDYVMEFLDISKVTVSNILIDIYYQNRKWTGLKGAWSRF